MSSSSRIVDLRTLRTEEWECLFRPEMPMLPQSISGIVDAAIATGRSVDLDLFIVERILARVAEILGARPATDRCTSRST